MGRKVTFYTPGMFTIHGRTGRYPGVSLTGSRCDLMCDHCKGTLLRAIPDCSTPEKLVEFAKKAHERKDYGMLLSGGLNTSGRADWAVFRDAIKEIKDTTDLYISAHVGFPTDQDIKNLKEAGIDQTLIDVIGDDLVAQRVYKIQPGVARDSAIRLLESGLRVAPHILIGLNEGSLSGEMDAVSLISNYDVDKVVFIVLRPTAGTPMENVLPPSPSEVAEVISYARNKLPDRIINLGCVRPAGYHKKELDILAIKAGVDGIAIPAPETIQAAKDLGIDFVEYPICCSMAFV
ncbi:MAG TPA: hypothetical protein PKV16_02610 [Caldisericia bacterium]|nr:hypothetical protein [Caldisericia bacterium]HPF48205.1 hypothetical protein [Caldisericia bacterium]HPI83859.1 hypothetical protein [Caldisericia bacterium]HPQ92658.1 hypothetical protein [Caldisericia bacterium]HRV74244.1 hypothetical protein [Caldisericia bacterium]